MNITPVQSTRLFADHVRSMIEAGNKGDSLISAGFTPSWVWGH